MRFLLSFTFMMLAFFVSAISIDIDVGTKVSPAEIQIFDVDNSTSLDAYALDGRLFDKQSWRKESINGNSILILVPIEAFIYKHSLEVGSEVGTNLLFGYVTNSNYTIDKIPNLANVNVHFGSINEFYLCFMSAHNIYKRSS